MCERRECERDREIEGCERRVCVRETEIGRMREVCV